MGRALLLARRQGGENIRLERYLDTLETALMPDNIVPRERKYASADRVSSAIFNPSGGTCMHGTSLAVGPLLQSDESWHKPGAPVPDGTAALLRVDADKIELATDAAGSRTIWYVLTDDTLIAATTQRAIVALLGDFRLNRDELSWMLSCGNLSGEGGWDTRIRQVRPGERVTLDRQRWRLTRQTPTVEFAADPSVDHRRHAERLAEVVEAVCRDWQLDPERWLLPLSGGTDSRGLLWLLREREGLRTITWGMSGTREQARNDAQIARAVAETFGVDNRFFLTDLSAEPRERLMQRFLTAGEGRVAKISGYLDGFRIWKTLFEEGVEGVIRGDEAFGSMFVSSDYAARYTANLTLLSDYFRPSDIATFELPPQVMPQRLERRGGESLETWRDRIYQEFRAPNLLAGLNDLKTAYVEVANPLLTRRVLELTRSLPDGLRTGKQLWREFVRERSPGVPFAQIPAVLLLDDFVSDKSMLELMLAELESADAATMFGRVLRDRVTGSIKLALSHGPTKRTRNHVRFLGLPPGLRAVARRWIRVKPVLHPMVFAFRAFVASRMNTLLKADAGLLYPRMDSAVNV
jgi:hypothetical protein